MRGRMAFKHHFSLPHCHGARGAEGRHFQGRITFPKCNHYTKSWSSSLTIRHGKYPEEDDPLQHQPKTRKVEESWSSTPPSGPRRVVQRSTANSVTKKRSAAAPAAANDEESDEENEARLKRPRNLPWPPKSVPSEVGNDEKPIDKRSMPITDLLREKFKEQNLDAEDWRTPIRAKLMSPEGVADLKMLKDYVLIAGDLYRRLPGRVLARCVNLQEAAKNPESLKFHDYYVSLLCSRLSCKS